MIQSLVEVIVENLGTKKLGEHILSEFFIISSFQYLGDGYFHPL